MAIWEIYFPVSKSTAVKQLPNPDRGNAVGVFLIMAELNILALSGGIATGKSTCCQMIQEELPEVVIFDADVSVARLYTCAEVLLELREYFGTKIILPDGGLDKNYLRSRAFSHSQDKEFLEQVFHRRVMEECLALLAETASKGASRLFVADIPLLFEGGFDFGQSANLLVATSRETQISRLKNRNDWDDETVEGVLNAQMPIGAKLRLADVVFWNEGPPKILKSQIHRYLSLRSNVEL